MAANIRFFVETAKDLKMKNVFLEKITHKRAEKQQNDGIEAILYG